MTNSIETTNIVIQSPSGDYLNPYVKPATVDELGTVKPDGTTITIAADGTISSAGSTPIATTEIAGKVKPDGTTITVAADGTITSIGGGGGGISNACYTATNPALTVVDNKLTWVITHNLNTTNIVASLYVVSTGTEIVKSISTDSANQITVTFTSSTDAAANTYKIVVITGEASLGNAGYTATCPALTLSNGELVWAITHGLNTTTVIASLYTSAGVELAKNVLINSANQITVTFAAETNAAAGDYKIVIMSTNSVIADDALSSTSINPIQNKVINTALIGKLDIDASNLSSAGQKVLDGQWVFSSSALAADVTAPTGDDISYNLSSYLPSDSFIYEVLFTGFGISGATSGDRQTMILVTDIQTSSVYLYSMRTRTASAVQASGNAIIPVGSGRTVTFVRSSSNTGTFSLYAQGYRRIGTNS